MTKYKIHFHTPEEVKTFVEFTSQQNYDIDISLNHISLNHYTIDAKSIMGIFSLDLSRELVVTFHCSDEETKEFYENFQKLLDN